MLIAEELALVAIDPDSGRHALGVRDQLNACLAGLLIGEVAFDGAAPTSPVLVAAGAVWAEKGPKVKPVGESVRRVLAEAAAVAVAASVAAVGATSA